MAVDNIFSTRCFKYCSPLRTVVKRNHAETEAIFQYAMRVSNNKKRHMEETFAEAMLILHLLSRKPRPPLIR